MSRFNVMPRAYRRQLQAQDEANVKRIVGEHDTRVYANTPGGDARKLRGIPAIGPNCPGHIRDTDPGGRLLRASQ